VSSVVTSRLALLEVPIDFVATGDNTLVAGVAGASVRAYHLFLVVSAATTLTFKRGGTSLSGPMAMTANGSVVLDFVGQPWLTTADGEALVLSQSGTAQVSGQLGYTQILTSA